MGTNSEVPKSWSAAIRAILGRLTALERTPNNMPFMSAFPNPDTLTLRGPLGTLKAADPVDPSDLVTLSFLSAVAAGKIGAIDSQMWSADGSYNYNHPSNLLFLEVWVAGAGGAGGSVPATSSGIAAVASSGASGSYSYSLLPVSVLSALEVVTVGAGGSPTASTGNAGGASSFGSHVTANGGPGGLSVSGVSTTYSQALRPGSAAPGTGQIAVKGHPGFNGYCQGSAGIVVTASGAPSPLFPSVAAQQAGYNANGQSGQLGGGGSGAGSRNSASAWSGGSGGDGVVLIKEWLAV